MADWKKLLVENPPASDIASSPSSGKVLKVSANGTGLEWADDAGGAFSDNGSTATVTDRVVTIQGSSSAIPTLDINPPSGVSGTSYSRIRVQTSGRDLRFNLRNGSSTSDVMTIAHNGSVGIGKTDPSYQLDISNNGGSAIRLARPSYATTIISSSSLGGLINVETNHALRLFTNNTERMRIRSGGNVGIGTSSPSAKLESVVTTDGDIALRIGGVATSTAVAPIMDFRGTGQLKIRRNNSDILMAGDGASDDTHLYTMGTQRLTIKGNTGNIGIGTSSPNSSLHINASDASSLIRFTNSGTSIGGQFGFSGLDAYVWNNEGNGKVILGTNSTARMTITHDAKVGIGTSSPSNKLHIYDGTYNLLFDGNEINHSDANDFFIKSGGNIKIQPSSSTKATFTSTGLGIGTQNPSEKLTISGGDILVDSGRGVRGPSGTEQIRFNTSSGVLINAGGAERVRINEHGLGINATPTDDIRLRVKASDNDDGIQLDDSSGNSLFKVFQQGSGVGRMFLRGGGSTVFNLTSGSDASFINIGQNFGIGTTSPSTSLHVMGGDGAVARFEESVSGKYAIADGNSFVASRELYIKAGAVSNDHIYFQNSSSTNMALLSNGNLGIGATSPTAKLQVQPNNSDLTSNSALGLWIRGNNAGIKINRHNGGTNDGAYSHLYTDIVSTDFLYVKNNNANNGGIATDRIGTLTQNPLNNNIHFDGYNKVFSRMGTQQMKHDQYGVTVSADLIIPTDSSSLSHKIKLTGDSTHEIYSSSYTLRYDANVGHRWNSSGNNSMTGGAGTIEFQHSTSSRYIRPAMTGFSMYASHDGKFGFISVGSTSTFNAIQQNFVDNNTSDLIFNSRASGSNTERVRIKSDGKVGIGINNPQTVLHTYGGTGLRLESNHQSSTTSLQFKSPAGSSNGGDAGGQINVFDATGNARIQHTMRRVSSASNGDSVGDYPYEWWSSNADGGMNFRMKLNRTGLGIGTQNPLHSVHTSNNIMAGSAGTMKGVFASGNDGTGNYLYAGMKGGDSTTAVKFGVYLNSGLFEQGYIAISNQNGGRVGVNTTSPTAQFHVNNTTDGTSARFSTNNTLNYIHLTNAGGANHYIQTNQHGLALSADENNTRGSIQLKTSNSTRLNVTNTGNIGIGTSSPSYNLHTTGDTFTSEKFLILANKLIQSRNSVGAGNYGNSIMVKNYSTGNMEFTLEHDSYDFVFTNGKVGIGTTSPSTELHVVGTIRLNSGQQLQLGGGSTHIDGDSGHMSFDVNSGKRFKLDGFSRISLSNNDSGLSNTIFGKSIGTIDSGSNYNTFIGDQIAGGDNLDDASDNTALGYYAMHQLTQGDSNVAIGSTAMRYVTTGHESVAIGYGALRGAFTGDNTVAIGFKSGYSITGGRYNTLVGSDSGYSITGNSHNTYVGNNAGHSANQSYNTYMGSSAGRYIGGGGNNVALGYEAMKSSGTASNNTSANSVAIGYQSLLNITTGSSNVALGLKALTTATTASSNVAIGVNAMESIPAGQAVSNAVAIGYEAFKGSGSTTTGANGTISIGYQSLKALTTGSNNLAIGYEAGKAITTVNDNTLVGYQSGKNTTGAGNSAFGMYSLYNNTSGGHNTAVGSQASQKITTAHNNVAIGHASGYGVTTGNDNINIGMYTSFYQQQGANNIAIGSRALQGSANFDASGNIAIGSNALIKLEGETGQVAVGHNSFIEMTTGAKNTGVGYQVGKAITTGYDNTLLGYQAGINMTQADSNVLIGRDTGDTIVLGRRNTIVGDQSDVSANGAINQIVLGAEATGVQDNSAIIGNSACADVFMGDNGSAWSTTSDGRLKENIEEWSTGLDAINKLRIVEYNFKEDNPYKYDHKKKRQGIIAQEAIEAIPEMIKDDGEWLTANQEPMIWALVNAVKELTKKVNILETKLNKEN